MSGGFRGCRTSFPALQRADSAMPPAYLDGPAGTQVPNRVVAAVRRAYETHNVNLCGDFAASQEATSALRAARAHVADFLGASVGDTISFGANMTTLTFSLSHAIGRALVAGDVVVITELDHEANRGPWLQLRERGVVVREVAMRRDGTLDAIDLERKISHSTRLVAMGCSSNALGTVNDVALARRLSRDVGAWLLLDAVHYAPHFAVDVEKLDVDYLLCSAYKFYGPHVGILYTRPGLLETLHTDVLCTQRPGAPYAIETGTLNLAAIHGVQAAIEWIATFGEGPTLRQRIVSAMGALSAYEHALAARCYSALYELPRARVWGQGFSTSQRAPTISFTITNRHASKVSEQLAASGVCVWAGNFYARRAIEVLGLAGEGGLVRAGISAYNTADDVDRLIRGVRALS